MRSGFTTPAPFSGADALPEAVRAQVRAFSAKFPHANGFQTVSKEDGRYDVIVTVNGKALESALV